MTTAPKSHSPAEPVKVLGGEAHTHKPGDAVQLVASHSDRGIAIVKAVASEGVSLHTSLGGYLTWNAGDLQPAPSPFSTPLRLSLDPGRGPLIKRGHILIARLPRCFGVDDGLKSGPRDDENETWNMGLAMVNACNSYAAHLAKIQRLETEVERLRNALQRISDGDFVDSKYELGFGSAKEVADDAVSESSARAALA